MLAADEPVCISQVVRREMNSLYLDEDLWTAQEVNRKLCTVLVVCWRLDCSGQAGPKDFIEKLHELERSEKYSCFGFSVRLFIDPLQMLMRCRPHLVSVKSVKVVFGAPW